MTMLQKRPYQDADLPQLQAAIASWTQAAGDCGYCHPGSLPHWIYEVLRGRWRAADLVNVWEVGGALVGLAICGLFDASFLVFLHPDYRGAGTEIELLQTAYQMTRRHLTATQEDANPVVTDVYSCDAIRMQSLDRLGFTRYRVWDHIRMRSLYEPIPEAQLPAGFAIRSATADDVVQLVLLRNEAFADHWTPELFREQVFEKPGYRLEWERVVVDPVGDLAASTVVRLDEANRVGLFEPVGTRPAFQRRGLARALMLSELGEMKRQGMKTARVEHDATNQAAGRLYENLGFRTQYETLGYQRP
jgi:GNAT superfamily N-acetyltransferase